MTTYDVKHDGTPVDDVLIADLAAEAERGYTADQLQGRPRGRGPPPLADKVKAVGSVRLDAQLRAGPGASGGRRGHGLGGRAAGAAGVPAQRLRW